MKINVFNFSGDESINSKSVSWLVIASSSYSINKGFRIKWCCAHAVNGFKNNLFSFFNFKLTIDAERNDLAELAQCPCKFFFTHFAFLTVASECTHHPFGHHFCRSK